MTSVWDDVVGQPTAVAALRAAVAAPVHAYLFTGPSGSTKHEAARAFAALLLAGVDDPTRRDARLALRGEHPDVHEVERVGPAISAEQAPTSSTSRRWRPSRAPARSSCSTTSTC